MPSRYLLNSSILFEAEKNRLSTLSAGQAPVMLNQPASRCLELLIKNHPEVVKQRDFFDYVWGEFGQNVPNNTLYQNISLLRKGLKAFGHEFDNAVITLPRQGFKLNPAIHITDADIKEDMDVALNDPLSADKNEKPVEIDEETLIYESLDSLIPPDLPQSKKKVTTLFVLFSLLLSMALGGIIGVIAESTTLESPPFDMSYLSQTLKLDGCTLYELKGSEFILTNEDIIHWGIQCRTSPYLYLMQYKYSALANILNCKSPLSRTTTPDCVNYFIVGRARP